MILHILYKICEDTISLTSYMGRRRPRAEKLLFQVTHFIAGRVWGVSSYLLIPRYTLFLLGSKY